VILDAKNYRTALAIGKTDSKLQRLISQLIFAATFLELQRITF